MIKLNSKLMLASTALVSAMAVSGVASALDLTIATDGAAPAGFILATDVNSDTNVDAGDTVTSTGGALALAAATDSVILSATGVTLTVSETITGATNTDDALIQLTGASNTLNINAALDANTGTATANAHGILVSAASNTINVSAAITEGAGNAAADGIFVGSNVGGTVINVLSGGNTGTVDFTAVSTAANVNTINISHSGTVGAVEAAGGSQNVFTMTGGTIGAVTAGAVSDTLTLTGTNQATIGALTLAAGNDTITLSGTDTSATTIAAVDGGTGTDSIAVTSGLNQFTSTIGGIENIAVSGGTMNVSGTITGATGGLISVASGATLNTLAIAGDVADISVTGTMNTTGAVNADAFEVVSGGVYTGNGALSTTTAMTVGGTVKNTGNLVVDAGGLNIASGGSVSVTGTTLVSSGDLTVAGTFLGTGNVEITADNATISGTVTAGGTFDVDGTNSLLTVANGGTLTVTGAAEASSMTIASGGTATLASTLGLSGNLVVNGTWDQTGIVTTTSTATFGAGSKTNLKGNLTGVTALSIADGAEVVVRNGATLNADTGAASSLKNVTIALGAANNNAGKVLFDTDGVDMNTSKVKLTAAQNVDLSAGYTYAGLVTGATAAAFTGTNAVTGNALYKYTWAKNAGAYDLTVALQNAGVTTLAAASTGVNNKGVAGVIDSAALSSLYEDVLAETDTNSVLESLTPDVSGGASAAAIGTSVASTGTVSNRLALLRGTDNGRSGMVAGEEMMANRGMWIQAFGTTAEQDERKGVKGYDATTTGLAIGVDSDELVDGTRVGVAFSYASADVDSDAASNAQTDIDAYQLSAYASHNLASGVYLDGMIGYSFNENKTERTALSNVYTGEYDSNTFTLSAEAGKSYDWKEAKVTPFVGFNYLNVESDNYREAGTGGAALSVKSDDVSAFLISVGSDIEWNIAGSNGATYMPYLRAKYSYDAIADEVQSTSNFLAGGAAFTSKGADVAKSTLTLGTGVNVMTAEGFEFTAAYDAEIKEDFLAHTGMLQARWAF